MEATTGKTTAAFIHLSTLSQYFIPFGNFLFPILLWSIKKDESEFIDYNGKQVINFQLSLFLYTLLLAIIAIPMFLLTFFQSIPLQSAFSKQHFLINEESFQNLNGTFYIALFAILIFIGLKITEFFLIIFASVKTSNGENYKYPLTISFIK